MYVYIVGAAFVLYNTARIATIIMKYNEKVSYGNYPSLPNIENVDFSQLHEEVQRTFLVNFILLQFCNNNNSKIYYLYNLSLTFILKIFLSAEFINSLII